MRYVFAALCLALASAPLAASDAGIPDLFRPIAGMTVQEAPSPAALEWQTATFDGTLLDEAALALDLAPGVRRIVRRDLAEAHTAGRRSWSGHLEGDSDRKVSLTLVDGHLAGIVDTDAGFFEIVPMSAGASSVVRLDQSYFPSCGSGGDGDLSSALAPETEQSLVPGTVERVETTPPAARTLDLLVAYTSTARVGAGSASAIASTIQAAVDIGNTAFRNSQMAIRFRLVGTVEVSFAETGDLGSELSRIRTDAQLATLRDSLKADMVGLVVEDGGGECGRAYVLGRNSDRSGFAGLAFQVTKRSCAVGNLSFVHESAHNLGMQHDPENGADPSAAVESWAFGHVVDGSYRTVMAYSSECSAGCPRVPYFSNPNVSYNGSRTGIAGQRDNHRVGDLIGEEAKRWRTQPHEIFDDSFERGNTSRW